MYNDIHFYSEFIAFESRGQKQVGNKSIVVKQRTDRHLATRAVVLDLHVVVLRPAAQLRPVQAQAALLVHLAVRRPGLVVVGAHLRNKHNVT